MPAAQPLPSAQRQAARGAPGANPSANPSAYPSTYWRRTLKLSAVLLTLWLWLSVAVSLWLPDWCFDFVGWPFGFWAAAQGALLLYCLIVWAYALLMDRLDAEHDPYRHD